MFLSIWTWAFLIYFDSSLCCVQFLPVMNSCYSLIMHSIYWGMFLLFLVFRTVFIKFLLVEVSFSVNWRWLCCFYPKCISVWNNAYWIVHFELTLHPWNEAHLAMVYHLLDVFLNLTCRNFTEKFVFVFTEEMGLQYFFSFVPLQLLYGTMLASEEDFQHCSSLFIFWSSLKNSISSYLKVSWNMAVNTPSPELSFEERNFIIVSALLVAMDLFCLRLLGFILVGHMCLGKFHL